MYRKLCFKSFLIIFSWFLFSTTDGELIVPCNVSVESEVRFVVYDYVITGIENKLNKNRRQSCKIYIEIQVKNMH